MKRLRLGLGLAQMKVGPDSGQPILRVTGGVITPFNSGGTDYIEIAFTASGSFTLSAPVQNARWALGAGGGAGGRVSNATTTGAPGGAGGLLRSASSVTLVAGNYGVTIGAGAPAVTAVGASANGSDSVLTTPSGTQTAVGGGKGPSSGTGNTDGGNGGSGGAGRSTGGTEGSTSPAGTGVAGQGFAGGLGYNSPTDANKATGGSGGAGSAGGNASLGVAGTAGAGVFLDWIATPRTVCAGQPGILATQTSATPDQTWGNGSQAAINAQVGKGGDGFMFLVVRAADVSVVMA